MKEGYIKRKTSTVPFGYEASEIDGYFKLEAGTGFILLVETETIGYVTTKMFFLLI